MAIENDPSARMQVRSRGELMHPGTCMVCGSGTRDEGYLDLQVFFDYEGTMYLCHTCVTQAGETIGMFTPEQVQSQLSLLEQLTQENAKYKEELDNVRPIISAFEHFMSTASPSNPSISDFVREESESLPAVVNGDSESVSAVTGGKPADSNDDDSSSTDGSDEGKSESEEPAKVTKRPRSTGTAARNITF